MFLIKKNIKPEINYMVSDSPVGLMLVGTVGQFVCFLKFLTEIPNDNGKNFIQEAFPSLDVKEVSKN